MPKGSHVNRYTSAFALDGAKLTRIMTILEARFQAVAAGFDPRFRVTLRNGKNIRVRTLDELLQLDNTVNNPVSSLEIRVDSDALDAGITFEDTTSRNIV